MSNNIQKEGNDVEVRTLRYRDFNAARKFAIEGMHVKRYCHSEIEVFVYSWFFFCMEILKASTALGAYLDDKLVGVLLVEERGKPKIFHSVFCYYCVSFVSWILSIFYKNSSGLYDEVNANFLKSFRKTYSDDGEIMYFAVDPTIIGKGIGSKLLQKFERQAKGKTIFLFTDDGCTYQFYEKRGFTRFSKQDIHMTIRNKKVVMSCFLYYKTI